MYQLSANIELLFTEAGPDAGDRVRAAAAAGFDAVEMWFSTDKDLDSLGKALADRGVQLTSLLAGPRMGYTFPGTDLTPFHEHYAQELRGQPPFDVTMMVTLLVYAYAVGVCSSRKIAAAC